jgi:hypothetical protein
MRNFFLFLSLTFLSGCFQIESEIPFSVEEAKYIQQNGTTTIEGHLFIQHFPKPISGAGEIVRLIPVTAYSKAWIEDMFGNLKYVSYILAPKIDIDANFEKYTRTTKTETDGRFTFTNVPAGHYYIQSQVTWRKDTSIITEGKLVYDDIDINGHETDAVKVILSGN